MSLRDEVIKSIRDNRHKRLIGEEISLPWHKLPRLSKVLPGIIPENYTIVTANQKVGKTQLSDFLYLYSPIDYLYENPNCNLDVEVIYYSLELSKEAKMRQAISYRLLTKYGVVISPQDLRSVFQDYILEENILKLIEQESDWFSFFESKVTFIDDIRNPYGIYLNVKNKCEAEGTYTYSSMNWINEGVSVTRTKRDKYIPNNPNKILIVVIDHASLLLPEKGDSLYDSIGKLSSRYILEMRDIWKNQICLVQQQTPTAESQHFTSIGGTVLDKVKPTADSLGYNKSTAQDCNLMLCLFHPARYNQKSYHNIDLTRMNDAHRELTIYINRDGISNASIDLYFNGASNYFEEIDRNNLERTYSRVELLKDKRYNR